MAFQSLAADASVFTSNCGSTSSPTHPCLPSKLRRRSCHLHPGNSSCSSPSLSSSLSFHLHNPGYGHNEASLFCVSKATRVQFEGQESRARFLECQESSILKHARWCQGAGKVRASHHHRKREMYHGSTESMEAYRCTESMRVRSCTEISRKLKRESWVCLGFGLHHGRAYARGLHRSDKHKRAIIDHYEGSFQLSTSWIWSCLPWKSSSFELRNSLLQRRNSNVCHCLCPNFFKKGFLATEKNEKLRQRNQQHALLLLCAQAMVASQIGQSSLLSFLWMKWPRMVDELCGGGKKGSDSERNASNGQAREPVNASFLQLPLWKALWLGFFCGSVIALAINSSMSVGALLDTCLWLCLLCSLLLLAAFCMRILYSMVMFISGGGITKLPNRCMRTLQTWVSANFGQVFFCRTNQFTCWHVLAQKKLNV